MMMDLQSNTTTTTAFDLFREKDDHILPLNDNEPTEENQPQVYAQSKESIFEQIQALTKQLAANQLQFDMQLKQYQQTLIEKEYQIQQQKQLIEKTIQEHDEKINKVKQQQQQKINHYESHYDQEKSKLYQQLQKKQQEMKSGEIEKLLYEFEQEQHSYPINDDDYEINDFTTTAMDFYPITQYTSPTQTIS
ncbi:hypothetical protein BJ944DRAFT_127038 [Cunninghamella echinulata]|nr:hypothetical protein BJ944DRAFT_127038 [Cunninghamella echinulata]